MFGEEPAGTGVPLVATMVAMTEKPHARAAGDEVLAHVVEGCERGAGRLLDLEVPHQADADGAGVVALDVRAHSVDRPPAKDAARRRDDEVVADRREPSLAVPALDLADVLRLRCARPAADPARRERGVVDDEVVEGTARGQRTERRRGAPLGSGDDLRPPA